MKERLPASFRACSGDIALESKCCCSCLVMLRTRSGHGDTVMSLSSHVMMTPCIRCDLSGGCRLDFFMCKPRTELISSKDSKPECAEVVGSMDP